MMNDENKHNYFDMSKHERDSAISFLLNSLLKAREVCDQPSNKKAFDEDVNIYLAHLLFANSFSDYQEMASKYLTVNVSELMQLLEQHPDKVTRYFIYKVNADYLLVHLGIFRDLNPAQPQPFKKTEQQFIELGQDYYDQASLCNQRIYRKKTAVGDVLVKLSSHFQDYQHILNLVRDDFFHFINWVRSHEETRKRVSVEPPAPVLDRPVVINLEQKQNEFLDIYGEWLNTKSEELIPILIRLTEELKRIDPKFAFDVQSLRSEH